MPLSDQDRDMLIRTVIGEAGDQSPQGQSAVAHVVLNRVASGQYGGSPSAVVLAPGQFEPWQTKAKELVGISPKSPQYQRVGQIVDSAASGSDPDPTQGATHFLDPAIVKARRGGSLPDWAQGKSIAIGSHNFYAPDNPNYAQSIQVRPVGTSGLSYTASPADLADTASALGITRSGVAPAASSAPVAMAPDLGETAKALGLTLGATPKAALPAAMIPPVDTVQHATPSVAADAAAAVKTGGGFTNAIAEGMPVVGPALNNITAATGAAIQPLVGADAAPDFQSRYVHNLLVEQEAARQYAAQNPLRAGAGNLVGGALTTAPMAGTSLGGRALGTVGSTIGSRLYGGTLGGTALGGLDAGLRGEDPLTGMEVGGALGAAGVLGGEGVGALTASGSNALVRPSGPLAGVNPVGRKWLATAMANETPASILAARSRMGPQGFAADLNPALTDLATGVAVRAEPPGSAMISEAYRLRQASAAGRIDNAITQAMGPRTDIVQSQQNIIAQRKAAADPLYSQWRSMQVHPTPEIKAMIPRLDAAGAFDQAEKLSGITGEPINKTFFTGGPNKSFPTTQTWDYVKRGLDSKIDQAYAAGDKTTARALINLKSDLINEIGKTPAGQVWQQARQSFAEPSALIDQIAAGRDTFVGGRSGLSADELRHELTTLSQPELMARIQGMRSAASEAMGDSLNGDTTLRNKLLAENNQNKIRMMLGYGPGQRLIDTLNQEKYLADQAKYVMPKSGSPTAGRTQAANALEAPPIPHWNPSLTEPLSFIPPSWIDAIRPSTVLQGGRDASYAGARQQIAGPLLSRVGGGLDEFLTAVSREASNRLASANRGDLARRLSTLAVTGPGSETARLRGNFGGALTVPAQ